MRISRMVFTILLVSCDTGESSSTEEIAAAIEARCRRSVRCGTVGVSCGDSVGGSSCVATIEKVSFDACKQQTEEDAARRLVECAKEQRAALIELYKDCFTETASSRCITKAELDDYYMSPRTPDSMRPDLASLPASCRALDERAERCGMAPGSNPALGP